jgi:hypothetical protein
MALNVAGFDLGIELPAFSTAGVGLWIALVLGIIMLMAIVFLVIYIFVYLPKVFNKKIVIFENIGGLGYRKTGSDTARVVKFGNFGDEVLFLRKRKVYRSASGKKMDNNTYWFAVGSDGYWYNIILGDLDTKSGILDIDPVDRDVKMMHVGLAKNIEKNYNKLTTLEKFGPLIMNGIFLIIMVIAVWLLMAKAGDEIELANKTIAAIKPLVDSLTSAAGNLDNICSGGSGIHPV